MCHQIVERGMERKDPVQKGIAIVVSGSPILPLRNWPRGRLRIKTRPGRAVRVYVKTKNAIQEFCVKEQKTIHGNYWVPAFRTGRNIRARVK